MSETNVNKRHSAINIWKPKPRTMFALRKFSPRKERNLKMAFFIHFFFISHDSYGLTFCMLRCAYIQANDYIILFLILMFRRFKICKITHPRNVACSSKQLFFPYQTVFFKNYNWRVYVVVREILNNKVRECHDFGFGCCMFYLSIFADFFSHSLHSLDTIEN